MERTELRHWTIVLIEDNSADVALCREALRERTDVDLDVYADPDEALRRGLGGEAETLRPLPDLVLVDLNLPGKDGVEVLHQIRAEGRTRHLPVVGISSSASPRDIERFYVAGGNCFVRKPLELEPVLETYRAICRFWLETAILPS